MRYLRRKMNFNGATRQLFSRNTWLPEGTVHLEWHKNNLNQIRFDYNLSTNAPQMMDMLDIAFNSDPLNPTLGNPNLKYGLRHVFNLKYNSMNFLWNKLHLMAGAKYTIDQRAVTYGTSYDMATGIRTTKPMNINGNRYGNFYIYASYRPVREKISSSSTRQYSPLPDTRRLFPQPTGVVCNAASATPTIGTNGSP